MEPTGWMDGSTDLCEQTFIFLVLILPQPVGFKDVFSPGSVIKAAFFQMGLMVCGSTTFG